MGQLKCLLELWLRILLQMPVQPANITRNSLEYVSLLFAHIIILSHVYIARSILYVIFLGLKVVSELGAENNQIRNVVWQASRCMY